MADKTIEHLVLILPARVLRQGVFFKNVAEMPILRSSQIRVSG